MTTNWNRTPNSILADLKTACDCTLKETGLPVIPSPQTLNDVIQALIDQGVPPDKALAYVERKWQQMYGGLPYPF